MPAQHKRPGRESRERRRRSARERTRAVIIRLPLRHEVFDPYRPGWLVAIAELEAIS